MEKQEDVHSSSPVRTPKLQLTAEQSTGECWVPPKKYTPYQRAKKKPQKDSRRGKITFRIKPYTCQRHFEGSNKPCVHQDPETPQTLSQNCVWVSPEGVWISSGLLQGQRATTTYTGLGKQTLGGHNQNLVCTRTQKKGADSTRD